MGMSTDHSLFLQADGTVKSCGANNSGQCGTGDTTNPKTTLSVIPELTNVDKVAVGSYHSLFLLKDGTVKSCGGNNAGQCGTGDTTNPKIALTLIPNLTDVAQIASFSFSNLFLLKDGTVKACGLNAGGECGTGDKTTKTTPTLIENLTDVVQVAVGGSFSLFLLKDGTVKACGENSAGQLGTGDTTSPKLTPFVIPGLTNVAMVVAGYKHSLFLMKDGTVKSCGNNNYGQCGTGGTQSPKLTLSTISGLTDVVKMAANSSGSFFVMADGTVKGCGNNGFGQFGTGNTASSKTALTATSGITNVGDVTMGSNYTLFLLKDGTVKACGNNSAGQLGTGDTASPKLTANIIPGLSTLSLQDSKYIITLSTPEELAIINLNKDAVTTAKINNAINLLNATTPKNYHARSQRAVAQHMPKKGDSGFTDYTAENFQARLDAATERAEKKHKEYKKFYNFLSKFPSMKI